MSVIRIPPDGAGKYVVKVRWATTETYLVPERPIGDDCEIVQRVWGGKVVHRISDAPVVLSVEELED